MRHLITSIALAFGLAGCAAAPAQDPQAAAFVAWATTMQDQVAAGQVKHSDYYVQAYDRLNAIQTGDPNKLVLQRGYADLIPVARAYESGAISREKFDDVLRLTEMARLERSAAIEGERQRAVADAMLQWNNYILANRPTGTTCSRLGSTVNCVTVP